MAKKSKQSTPSRFLNIIFTLGLLILWVYVYMWIYKLETIGCECSKDWKRTFMYVYVCIMIPVMICKIAGVWTSVLWPLTLFLSVMFISCVFFYIKELKRTKCECSESDTRTVLEIVNYIQIGILLIGLIMLLLLIIK